MKSPNLLVIAAIMGSNGRGRIRRVQEGAHRGQSILSCPHLLCLPAALSLRLFCLQERHWVLEEQEECGGSVCAYHWTQLRHAGQFIILPPWKQQAVCLALSA